MNLKRNLAFLLQFLWIFSVAQQYSHYTEKDGLPSNHIYKITQDHDGFIWIITPRGISKYNGSEFKNFTTQNGLANNDIWDMRTTPSGRLWYFGKAPQLGYIYKDSVYKFGSENDVVFNPFIINQIDDFISFGNQFRWYTLKTKINLNGKKETLWSPVLDTYNNKKFIPIFHKTYKGLSTNSDINDIVFLKNDGSKDVRSFAKLIDDPNYKFGQINDSTIYLGSNYSIFFLNLNTGKISKVPLKKYFKIENGLYTRVHLINNEIQITGLGFVGVLNDKFEITKSFIIPEEFNSHFSFIDKDGNVWIATQSKGIFKLPTGEIENKTLFEDSKTAHLTKINNKLVLNVLEKGFFVYDSINETFNSYILTNEHLYFPSYIDFLNTEYYPSYTQINSVKNLQKKTTNFPNNFNGINLTAKKIISINENIYGFSPVGINKLDPKSLKVIKYYELFGVKNIVNFQNRFLIGTSDGLKEFRNEKFYYLFFKNINIIKILPINKENVLIATDGFGAYISNLKTYNKLPHSGFSIVQDAFVNANEIWLATNNGVLKYIKNKNLYAFEKKYDMNYGLPTDNISSIAISNNKILLSSSYGVSVLPIKLQNNDKELKIYIEKTRYNSSIIKNDSKIDYTPDNHISFLIQNIDFSEHSSKHYFEYILLPIQKKWNKTDSYEINFNNLKPNDYQLIIRSGKLTDRFNFSVEPLWWQLILTKILFLVLIFSIIIFVLYKLNKINIARKLTTISNQKKMLENEIHALRSHMNPHFVFNSLNAIHFYLSDNNVKMSEKYLVKFSKLIRMFFDYSQQKHIYLDDEINLLTSYLEIEKLRFGEDFDFTIKVDPEIPNDFEIPSMLLQPLVENAVNHGVFHKKGKGIIDINFIKTDRNSVQISIEDNGIGRKKAQEIKEKSSLKSKTSSTQIIQERVNLLNQSGEWEIDYKVIDIENTDNPDNIDNNGTIVILEFKSLI